MIRFFERVFNRLYVFFSNKRYHRELTEKKLAADNAVGNRAAQGIQFVEPRIDPNTLTVGDWMKVLETQEKRLTKLRAENIDLRETIRVQQHDLNVFKRALDLVGVNTNAVHAMMRTPR